MSRSSSAVLALSVSLLMAGCSSMSLFSRDKKTDAGPQFSEQVYYERAQRSLERNQLDDATRALEALDTYYPTGPYTEQAQLDLMYTRFRQSDYAGAVSVADRFIRLYPTHAQLDYAYYLRGVANMEIGFDSLLRYTSLQQAHRDVGFLRLAYDNLTELLQRFPNTRFRYDATQRLQHITHQFAENEINVARYNVRRGAWVGAAQRARWVLEYYPQTPQIPEAIATLAYSYQKLGMTKEAAQYRELLRLNYPSLVQGDSVNLSAAQHKPSLLNRLTLGIAGDRHRDIQPVTQTENTVEQPISRPSRDTLPSPVAPTPPPSLQSSETNLANLGVRLGLPEQSNTNSVSDAQPADQATPVIEAAPESEVATP
ncbi:MAG: outer membrane protein assembly factor BamD [Pseudomonadota bacterium]|nr:outer membrane protein assembly factor BamD [Pseudomonadota bacterium]